MKYSHFYLAIIAATTVLISTAGLRAQTEDPHSKFEDELDQELSLEDDKDAPSTIIYRAPTLPNPDATVKPAPMPKIFTEKNIPSSLNKPSTQDLSQEEDELDLELEKGDTPTRPSKTKPVAKSKQEEQTKLSIEVARTIDATPQDLKIRLWKTDKGSILESTIDMKDANQEVLALDDWGRLKTRKLEARNSPFLRLRLSGEKKDQLLNLKCDENSCVAVWPKFPLHPKKLQKLELEAHLRGKMPKKWQIALNQLPLPPEPLIPEPSNTKKQNNLDAFLQTKRTPRDWYIKHPQISKALKVQTIEDWALEPHQKISGVKQINVDRLALLQVPEDPILLQIESKKKLGLETYEIAPQTQVWLHPGLQISILTTKKSSPTKLRKIEFTRKKL